MLCRSSQHLQYFDEWGLIAIYKYKEVYIDHGLKFFHFSKFVPEQDLLQAPLFASVSDPYTITNTKVRPFTAFTKQFISEEHGKHI